LRQTPGNSSMTARRTAAAAIGSPAMSCMSHATLLLLKDSLGSKACKREPVPRAQVGPRECWSDAESKTVVAAPLRPLRAGRRSCSALRPVVGARQRCLVCTELLPEQSAGRFVRKAFGKLWLCTACVTDKQLSPLKSRRQPSDMWVAPAEVMLASRKMTRSSSTPGLIRGPSGCRVDRGCKLCCKPLSPTKGSALGSACASAGLCRSCLAEGEFEDMDQHELKPTPRILLNELLLPACVADSIYPESVI